MHCGSFNRHCGDVRAVHRTHGGYRDLRAVTHLRPTRPARCGDGEKPRFRTIAQAPDGVHAVFCRDRWRLCRRSSDHRGQQRNSYCDSGCLSFHWFSIQGRGTQEGIGAVIPDRDFPGAAGMSVVIARIWTASPHCAVCADAGRTLHSNRPPIPTGYFTGSIPLMITLRPPTS